MSASMFAPMLTSARTRWPLPLVVLFVACVARVSGPSRLHWFGSDLQGIIAAILYLALVPMFVIAFASAWLRGDIGAWSWALARPVSRTRWLLALLVVDVATLAMCIGCVLLVVGPLPRTWLGPWEGGERIYAYVALLAAVYSVAALAGARGASAIGASLYVVALGGILVLGIATADFALHQTWRTLSNFEALTMLHEPGSLYGRYMTDLDPRALGELSVVVAIASATIVLARRAAAQVPVPPRPASWVIPIAIGIAGGALVTPILYVAVVLF